MGIFERRPLNPTKLNRTVAKYPGLFGIPFVLLMVAASYGLSSFTQIRYDLQDKKQKQVSKEQELGLNNMERRRKFDIREEYFKLSAAGGDENWDPTKRISRPAGTPEWGLPPPEPEQKK